MGLVSQAGHDGGRHVLGFMIAVSVHPDLKLERLRQKGIRKYEKLELVDTTILFN